MGLSLVPFMQSLFTLSNLGNNYYTQYNTTASAILQNGPYKLEKKKKSARSDEGLRVPMMDAAFPLCTAIERRW